MAADEAVENHGSLFFTSVGNNGLAYRFVPVRNILGSATT